MTNVMIEMRKVTESNYYSILKVGVVVEAKEINIRQVHTDSVLHST